MPLCVNNVHIYCQILTSMQQIWIIAMHRPLVWTLMVVTSVHATLGTLEMDNSAMVNSALD